MDMKQIRSIFLAFATAALLLISCKQPDMQVNTTIEVPVGVIEVSYLIHRRVCEHHRIGLPAEGGYPELRDYRGVQAADQSGHRETLCPGRSGERPVPPSSNLRMKNM